MAVYFYEDLQALKNGTAAEEVHFQRQLAPSSEGTPSFENVKWAGHLLTSDL